MASLFGIDVTEEQKAVDGGVCAVCGSPALEWTLTIAIEGVKVVPSNGLYREQKPGELYREFVFCDVHKPVNLESLVIRFDEGEPAA